METNVHGNKTDMKSYKAAKQALTPPPTETLPPYEANPSPVPVSRTAHSPKSSGARGGAL